MLDKTLSHHLQRPLMLHIRIEYKTPEGASVVETVENFPRASDTISMADQCGRSLS